MIKKTNEHGFTLIEVVASLLIISIILLTFSQFFIQNYKTANRNIEKLVVVNLADGYLEHLKVERLSPSGFSTSSPTELQVNDKTYTLSIAYSQNMREENMKLMNVVVTVQAQNSPTKGVVEGYVPYD